MTITKSKQQHHADIHGVSKAESKTRGPRGSGVQQGIGYVIVSLKRAIDDASKGRKIRMTQRDEKALRELLPFLGATLEIIEKSR